MLKLLTKTLSPDNPTIGVQWCLDPKDFAKLKELGVTNAYVLLVTLYDNDTEDRQLRPLEEGMTYVGFRRPGKHMLLAKLVWPEDSRNIRQELVKMQRHILQKSNRAEYLHEVLQWREAGDEPRFRHIPHVEYKTWTIEAAEPLVVEVGSEHFGKEWPTWARWWVNRHYPYPPQDQCEQWRRLPYAILIQPFVMLAVAIFLAVVSAVVTLGSLLLAVRGLDLGAALRGDFKEIWPKVEFRDRTGGRCWGRLAWAFDNKFGEAAPWRLLGSPLGFSIYAHTIYLLHRKWHIGYLAVLVRIGMGIVHGLEAVIRFILKHVLILGLEITAMLVVVLAGMILGSWWAKREWDKHKELLSDPVYQAKLKAEADARYEAELERARAYLSCPTAARVPLVGTLQALPPERRTIRLKFYDFKRKVCRQYAR